MNAFSANPLAYIFPTVLLLAVLCYYAYGAVDRLGLPTRETAAIVTGKKFTPGSKTYNTNVVGGQTLTQSYRQADFYAVSVEVAGVQGIVLVDPATFAALQINDRVSVSIQRTRLSGQLLVTQLRR